MANKEKDEKLSLVLSIFKGENFVCKNPHGLRVQIDAKCCDQVLQSGTIPISSTNSEPIFNFQLAWQFSRKQLKELRGNKIPVKVRCLVQGDDNKLTELGYTVLHVKDAFPWSGGDVDASKARSYPLLGTKEQWNTYHPKLYMQLHIEDYTVEHMINNPNIQNKAIEEVEKFSPQQAKLKTVSYKEEIHTVDKTPRVEIIPNLINSGEKFIWRISDEDGCFQLGEPSDYDDLYIFNTTIVSASNLHLLWNGRSPKKASGDDYVWQLRYKAYGCEIKSDPFILSKEDTSRRTFIGDKATARIRSNAPLFYEYLNDSAIEFHVIRYELSPDHDLTNENVMGVSFAELRDLSQSNASELRATLEIVSEWGYPSTTIPTTEKPEVRVVFQLEANPGYFGIKSNNNDSMVAPSSENMQNEPTAIEEKSTDDHISPHDESIDEIMRQINEMALQEKQQKQKEEEESKAVRYNERTKQYSENDIREFYNSRQNMASVDNHHHHHCEDDEHKIPTNEHSISEANNKSPAASNKNGVRIFNEKESETSNSFSSPEKIMDMPIESPTSNSSPSGSSKENSHMTLPDPGLYKVTINLGLIFLKSRTPLTDEIVLSYVHPKFGIDQAKTSTAMFFSEYKPFKNPNYQCFKIEDGITSVEASYEKFSEKLINDPLTIEFRVRTREMLEPMFGFSMIPVGNVFLQHENNCIRTLKGKSDILKTGQNSKIGILKYRIDVTSCFEPNRFSQRPRLQASDHLNKSPIKHEGRARKAENQYLPSIQVLQTQNLGSWKSEKKEEFQEELKRKERAYLQILAEEAAARDKEREKALTEKMSELKRKEKDLRQQAKILTDLEERLKLKESELTELNQKTTLDRTSILENAKLSIRRMQEEHKIEISSLKRRNEEFEMELKKYRGKLDILELKLEEKDEYINKLKSERYQNPDMHQSEKLKLLDQENKLLKKQITDLEKARDQYKKQSQTLCLKLARVQEERDRQLKDENESLRLQILASKEHKELRKERKVAAGFSEQIRTMQDEKKYAKEKTIPNITTAKKSPHQAQKGTESRHPKTEEEIRRLTDERRELLHTGAYTKYDMVIKEMERRIIGLADGHLVK